MPSLVLLITVLVLAGVRLGVDPLAAESLALAAAGLAALSFSPGDPPRGPLLLRTAAVGLVLAAHALQRLAATAGGLDLALIIVANLLGAAAVLGFLRVVRRSGLAAPATPLGAAVLAAHALAAAALVVVIVGQVAGPGLRAATIVVSTVCDALVFVGSAVLLRMVLPLRGGLVAQPYFLLALDGLCFLVADLAHAAGAPELSRALPWLAALGGAAGATAGLAQASLLRR